MSRRPPNPRGRRTLATPVAVAVGVASVGYLIVIVGLPVGAIFYNALFKFRPTGADSAGRFAWLRSAYHSLAAGLPDFWDALRDEETLHALGLTLTVCAVVVPLNTVFGLAAAWVLARQRFLGRGLLAAMVNLPLAVAPTIAGLFIVLTYSPTVGLLHAPVEASGLHIVFAWPGLVLATLLVTVPMVALEVLPSLEQLDPTESQAARTLGATGWQTFWRVTLPAIKWSVLYGVVLCTAKAAGEFGAVSGVSGRLIGETNTLTLHIERAYAEYESTKAFASATLLTLLAVGTLAVNVLLSRRLAKRGAT